MQNTVRSVVLLTKTLTKVTAVMLGKRSSYAYTGNVMTGMTFQFNSSPAVVITPVSSSIAKYGIAFLSRR